MLLDGIRLHKGARPLAVVICTGVKTLELLIVDNIHTFEPYSVYMHNKNMHTRWYIAYVIKSVCFRFACNWIQYISVVQGITESLLCVTCRSCTNLVLS